MKTEFRLMSPAFLAALWGLALAAAAEPVTIRYEVKFKDFVMATQTLVAASADGLTTLAASFEADLPVFVALQHYAEQQSVTTRPDGSIERLGAVRRDGPLCTVVDGLRQPDGRLKVVRTDRAGATTNYVSRSDYDFHSLVLYGTAPADFLPTNQPARVLDVAEGRIVPVFIQSIAEGETTPERQHVASTHLVWTADPFVSHSWHPATYSHLPRRYVRQTESGEFTFTLLR